MKKLLVSCLLLLVVAQTITHTPLLFAQGDDGGGSDGAQGTGADSSGTSGSSGSDGGNAAGSTAAGAASTSGGDSGSGDGTTGNGAGSSSCDNCFITKFLTYKTRDFQVLILQKFLNLDSRTALKVAAGSEGSPGKETDYFGPATVDAVQRFQMLQACTNTDGVYGDVDGCTRLKINEMIAANPAFKAVVEKLYADYAKVYIIAPTGSSASNNGVCTEVGKPLTVAYSWQNNAPVMTGVQVKIIQRFLNVKGFPVAASGDGSMGRETENYGRLTAVAVEQFQKSPQYQALYPGYEGLGIMTSCTRRFMNDAISKDTALRAYVQSVYGGSNAYTELPTNSSGSGVNVPEICTATITTPMSEGSCDAGLANASCTRYVSGRGVSVLQRHLMDTRALTGITSPTGLFGPLTAGAVATIRTGAESIIQVESTYSDSLVDTDSKVLDGKKLEALRETANCPSGATTGVIQSAAGSGSSPVLTAVPPANQSSVASTPHNVGDTCIPGDKGFTPMGLRVICSEDRYYVLCSFGPQTNIDIGTYAAWCIDKNPAQKIAELSVNPPDGTCPAGASFCKSIKIASLPSGISSVYVFRRDAERFPTKGGAWFMIAAREGDTDLADFPIVPSGAYSVSFELYTSIGYNAGNSPVGSPLASVRVNVDEPEEGDVCVPPYTTVDSGGNRMICDTSVSPSKYLICGFGALSSAQFALCNQ